MEVKVAARRKELGLTQEELARMAGVGQPDDQRHRDRAAYTACGCSHSGIKGFESNGGGTFSCGWAGKCKAHLTSKNPFLSMLSGNCRQFSDGIFYVLPIGRSRTIVL